MAQGFSAQVSAWVAETKQRMLAVRNESIQRVIEIAQTPVAAGGNLPIQTGFLRSSLMFSTGRGGNFPLTANPNPDGKFSYDPGNMVLVLVNAPLGETIEAAYVANYARHVEYGARGRAGRRFVGLAAQQWPRIVEEVSREAEARNT